MLLRKITVVIYIRWCIIVVIRTITVCCDTALALIWSFILTFTLFVNSNPSRFYSIRSFLTLIELVCVSVELCGWSISLWNLWWSSSICNNAPATSFFSLLPTFVCCSLFLVYSFSKTVKFLITFIRLSMISWLFLSSPFNKEIISPSVV